MPPKKNRCSNKFFSFHQVFSSLIYLDWNASGPLKRIWSVKICVIAVSGHGKTPLCVAFLQVTWPCYLRRSMMEFYRYCGTTSFSLSKQAMVHIFMMTGLHTSLMQTNSWLGGIDRKHNRAVTELCVLNRLTERHDGIPRARQHTPYVGMPQFTRAEWCVLG